MASVIKSCHCIIHTLECILGAVWIVVVVYDEYALRKLLAHSNGDISNVYKWLYTLEIKGYSQYNKVDSLV